MVSYVMDIPKRVRCANKQSYDSLLLYVVSTKPHNPARSSLSTVPCPLRPLLEGTQGSAGPLKVIWKGNILLLVNIEVWKDTKFKKRFFPGAVSCFVFSLLFFLLRKNRVVGVLGVHK